jgi:hypothetical protein
MESKSSLSALDEIALGLMEHQRNLDSLIKEGESYKQRAEKCEEAYKGARETILEFTLKEVDDRLAISLCEKREIKLQNAYNQLKLELEEVTRKKDEEWLELYTELSDQIISLIGSNKELEKDIDDYRIEIEKSRGK